MKTQLIFLFVICLAGLVAKAESITVAELTLRVGTLSTEELYYSFAEGDRIIFSMREVNGFPIKLVEISEGEDHSLFQEFRVNSIKEKQVRVQKTGVYKFRFENVAVLGRTCRIRIERIPANEATRNFDTAWEWAEVHDTIYIPYKVDSLTGHDTTYATVTERQLASDDLILQEVLINHSIEVHSQTHRWPAVSGTYSQEIVQIDLPQPIDQPYRKEETVAWYYAAGVNQKLKLETQKQRSDLLAVGGNIASVLAGPEMKVVFTLIDLATTDHSDESIYCALITDRRNALLFKSRQPYYILREDNLVSTQGVRIDDDFYAQRFLGFSNPNLRQAITVYVSVVAWRRVRIYKNVERLKAVVTPTYVSLDKQRLNIHTSKIRVPVGLGSGR